MQAHSLYIYRYREEEGTRHEKENKSNDAGAANLNEIVKKRKLSESDSEVSAPKKRAYSESQSDNINSLEQTGNENNFEEVMESDDQSSVKPTKIKIALKINSKRSSASSEPRHMKETKRKLEDDDESDIFDDLDVERMNVVEDAVSSIRPSLIGEPARQDHNCSEKNQIYDKSKTEYDGSVSLSNNEACHTPKLLGGDVRKITVCSPAVLEDRKHRMKVEIAKLIVKINEGNDDLEKCVERQEFLKAQEIKTSVAMLQEEKITLSLILDRENATEIKEALEQRYKRVGLSQLASTPKSTKPDISCVKQHSFGPDSAKQKDATKDDKKVSPCGGNNFNKKLTPNQQQKLKEKEERARTREEEKMAKELEKKLKEEIKEKEREERNAQKELEKKEREEKKEKEKKDKEQQKERERIERLEQKQKERIEKERIRLAKEEEKIKRQLDKEIEKEELKKEREEEKLKKEKEKERLKKEREEERERLEVIEKQKQAKIAKTFLTFFTKRSSKDIQSNINDPKSTSGDVGRCNQNRDCSLASGVPQHFDQRRNNHLTQFLIKENMRVAPVSRKFIELGNKSKLDDILKSSRWEISSNTYINILKSEEYLPSRRGHTWPIQDLRKAQGLNECNGDDEQDIQVPEEEDEEEQTVASLLELDQSKIVEVDIPDDNLAKGLNERSNNSEIQGQCKTTGMFCTTKAKLLQFHENERPPYWGTWSKKSNIIGPRRPFAQDCHYLDYDYDSDDDWEEEEEGESLSDEEKDKEEDQDLKDEDDDDDDGFFVGHGVLDKEEAHLIDSDEEENAPEKVKTSGISSESTLAKLEEDLEIQKMKMRAEQFEEEYRKQKEMPTKLKPRVFGCFWKNSVDGYTRSSKNSDKEKLVHDQLMKILQPYCCVVLLGENEIANDSEENIPIDTSHSINIRVSNFIHLSYAQFPKALINIRHRRVHHCLTSIFITINR